MDIKTIKPGDHVKIRVATRSGLIHGWRVVKAVRTTFIEVRAHGYGDFIVKPHEIETHEPA